VAKRPSEYVWFTLHFQLRGGCIQVTQQRETYKESVRVSYRGLAVHVMMRDNNTHVQLALATFKIDIIDSTIIILKIYSR
jgi:hypothetical protein